MDEEVQQLVEHINKLVKDNSEDCRVSLALWKWFLPFQTGGQVFIV